MGTIEHGRGAKGDRVRSEIVKPNVPFLISEIEAVCAGVSRDIVRLVLRAMKRDLPHQCVCHGLFFSFLWHGLRVPVLPAPHPLLDGRVVTGSDNIHGLESRANTAFERCRQVFPLLFLPFAFGSTLSL